MIGFIVFGYKAAGQVRNRLYTCLTSLLTRAVLSLNGIKVSGKVKSAGMPIVHLSLTAQCYVGKNLTLGNWDCLNASGLKAKCKLEVRNGATLRIGDNVGMTSTTIMCFNGISIGDNVKLGVGTHIYDTDFHNIDPLARLNGDKQKTVKTSPVVIGNNVFVGAYSIILKGVTIGDNSVIGAGSVVTKDVPANEVWAGNPARFMKKL